MCDDKVNLCQFRLTYRTDKVNLCHWIQRIKDVALCYVTIHNERLEVVYDARQFPYEPQLITRLVFYPGAHKSFYASGPKLHFTISPAKWLAALRSIVRLKGKNKSIIALESRFGENQLIVSLGTLSDKRDSWNFHSKTETVDINLQAPLLKIAPEIRPKMGRMSQFSRIVIPIKILNDICTEIAVVHCLDDLAPLPGTRPTKMILFTLCAKYIEISSDPNYRARARFRIGNSTPSLFKHSAPVSQLHSFRDFAAFCGKQKSPRLVIIGMAPNMALVLRQEENGIAARETYSAGVDFDQFFTC